MAVRAQSSATTPAKAATATPTAVAEAFHAALFSMRSLTTANLVEAGITGPQAGALWLLYEFKSLSPARLAEMQGGTAANMTGIIQRLERDGLVTRKAHPTDQRVKLIELTSEGVARTRKARIGFEKTMAHLFSGASQADLDVVLRVLQQVRERADPDAK